MTRSKVLGLLALLFTMLSTVLPSPAAPARIERATKDLGDFSGPTAAAATQGRVIDEDLDPNLVAFDWSGKAEGALEVRAKGPSGWTEWFEAHGNPDEGPDSTSKEYSARTSTGVVWLGLAAEKVEVRGHEGRLRGVRMHLLYSPPDSKPVLGIRSAGADPARPGIISRSGWGADETLRRCDADYSKKLSFSVVHHTATGNTYTKDEVPAIIRGIYVHHTINNGWCDIGYNFLIDKFGRVFEGRFGGVDKPVIGAHAGGFNSESTGASIIGDYTSTGLPPDAKTALRSLLAWKLDLHGVYANTQIDVVSKGSSKYDAGVVVKLWTISGHQDVSATACPGGYVYQQLPSLRGEVQREIDLSDMDAAPDVASWAPGRLDVFSRGADGSLTHKWWDGRTWSAWESLGGFLTSAPTAVSWGPNRIDVFAKGGDNALWHKWWDGTGWYGWESLGGYIEGGGDVASWDAGRLDVFVKGSDSALWKRSWDGRMWTGWESLGGHLASEPSAVSWGPGRIDVFVRGSNDAVWHKFYQDRWTGWNSIGGMVDSAPDAASWAPGRLDVFAKAASSQLVHAWYTGSWAGWEGLGYGLGSDPGAISWGPNRIDVFGVGADKDLWQNWWDGLRWSP